MRLADACDPEKFGRPKSMESRGFLRFCYSRAVVPAKLARRVQR